jgi:hypothetical protein
MTRWRCALHNPVFLTGLAVFVVGSGPLLLVLAATSLGLTTDPNPNPVGLGIMAFLTFWPGLVMTAVGLVIGFWRAGRNVAGAPGPKSRAASIPEKYLPRPMAR